MKLYFNLFLIMRKRPHMILASFHCDEYIFPSYAFFKRLYIPRALTTDHSLGHDYISNLLQMLKISFQVM